MENVPRADSDALYLARSVWRRAIPTAEAAELQRQQARALVDRIERAERDLRAEPKTTG